MKKVYFSFLLYLLSFSVPLFGSVIVVGEKNGWELDEGTAYESMSALRTPTITDGESVSLVFEVTASRIDWKIKTSTEENYDKLTICIDPESENESNIDFSGDYDWRDFSHEWSEEGSHTVKITFSKDGSVANGDDCCWIWFEGIEAAFKGEDAAPKRWEFSDGKEWEYESSLSWYESWNSGITLDSSTYKGYRNPTVGYLKSPKLSDGEEAWMSYEVEGVLGLGFDFCLESEADSDYLIVYVDGEEKMRLSGSHWGESKMLPFSDDGKHTVKWVYRRDSNGNKAQFYDCVSIHFDGVEDIVKSHFKNDKTYPWVRATSDDGIECLRVSAIQNGSEAVFEFEVTPEMLGWSLQYRLKDSSMGDWTEGRGSLSIYVNNQKELETSLTGDGWTSFDYGYNVGDKVRLVFSVNDYVSEDEDVSCMVQIPCMDDYFSVYKDMPDDEQAQVEKTFYLDLRTGRDAQRTILDGDEGVSFASGEFPAWMHDETEGAMRSAEIARGGESWMSATVVGKGTFSFRWKCSGETLSCYVDGELKETLYGAADWTNVDVALENDARHEIKWVFARGEDSTDAAACGWVDGIVWEAPEGWDDPDELIVPHTVSGFFLLDTRPSPRVFDTTNFCERITYDPAWRNAASVVLTVDASEAVKTTESGAFEWKSEKEGLFEMKLEFLDSVGTAIGEPLTASFKIALDPLPALGENATADDVATILGGVADAKLKVNVADAADYANFRAWLEAKGIDHNDVAKSLFAWLSYALDTAGLVAAGPKEGDVTIDTFEKSATDGAFDFTVKIDGIAVGENALEANIRKVFDVEGAADLGNGTFSDSAVEINAASPENGKVKFTVAPKGENTPQFFFKVKLK